MDAVHKLNLLRVFLFPALGGFLFGYDIGSTSFVLTQIVDGKHDGVHWNSLVEDSSALQGGIASMGVAGALVGSILVFTVADTWGRRKELLLGSVLYMIGGFIEALSADPTWDSATGLGVLFTGRLVYGIGVGFSMHGAPAYIAEMAPASVRGLLVSLKEAFIVLGILMGYVVGYICTSHDGAWRYTYGSSIPVSVVMLIGVLGLPDSCRFLALVGKQAEALASLQFVLLEGADEALEAINEQISTEESKRPSNDSKSPSLFNPKYGPALIAGLGIVCLQQITGQPSVLYYANTIFSDAGLEAVATVGVGAFKLVATLVACCTVDKFGRKLLLFWGISLMAVALLMLTIAFQGYQTTDDDNPGPITDRQIVILLAMFTYIGGYQIGFGPIAWLMISEVFPLEVRGQAISVAVQTNFFFNLAVTYLFPLEIEGIGGCYTFAVFLIVDVFAILFVYVYVPETKGLTLEQIEQQFHRTSDRKVSKLFQPLLPQSINYDAKDSPLDE